MFGTNKTKFFLMIAFSLIFGSVVSASPRSDAVYKVAVKALSQKLQSDLAADAVDLKLEKVNSYHISKNEIVLKGSGKVDYSPIRFNVTVNTLKDIPTSVSYDFIKNAAEASDEPNAEDALTRSLLLKLKHDYNTVNIVIALDEVNIPVKSGGREVFKGSGDVRIGFDWQKIDYTVALDSAGSSAKVVDYSVK